MKDIYYNASPAVLYEQALRHEEGDFAQVRGQGLKIKASVELGVQGLETLIEREREGERDMYVHIYMYHGSTSKL